MTLSEFAELDQLTKFVTILQNMSWTREQLSPSLDKNKQPDPHVLLKPGKKYMGRDVPDGYFRIQDWCVEQGIATQSHIPDLTHILQGVEYILQAGTGQYPNSLKSNELKGIMTTLNREEDFKDGVLHQFPELLSILKQELLNLPSGQTVIKILGETPEHQDLFKE